MLSHYMRMLIFAVLLIAGLQVPGFVDQYGKALHAHWSESEQAVAAFRDDAQHFFNADMDRLVQHYLQQTDPVMRKGGENIKRIVARNRLLTDSLAAFRSSKITAYAQTFLHPVTDIRNEVWQSFSLTVPLNMETVAFGFGFALTLSLLLDLLLLGIKKLLLKGKKNLQPA